MPTAESGEKTVKEKKSHTATKAKASAKKEAPHKPAERKQAAPKEITTAIVKKAKKAELEEYCKRLGLSTKGKVEELRERLLEHVEKKSAKEAKPEKAAKRKEEEAEGEEVKIEEEGAYVPKQKPSLDEGTRRQLSLREGIASRRPRFLRQEWFRYKRLGLKWRRPQGGQSKLRRHLKYRINVVSIGYRGPAGARGLHPSGFKEVLVHNPKELEGINPSTQAVRIAHAVGMKKRKQIEEAAAEKGLRVLNRSGEVES